MRTIIGENYDYRGKMLVDLEGSNWRGAALSRVGDKETAVLDRYWESLILKHTRI
jgi:hypothetical protein